MDIEKLIERLKKSADFEDYPVVASFAAIIEKKYLREAATALSTLQAENKQLRGELEYEQEHANAYHEECGQWEAENEKMRAELEQVIAERGALIEDFVDYVTDGVPNPAIFCKNRCNKCVDMRGWCTGKNCKGFYPSVASDQKED